MSPCDNCRRAYLGGIRRGLHLALYLPASLTLLSYLACNIQAP